MIKFTHRGDFSKFEQYLKKAKQASSDTSVLDKYGSEGVRALSRSTPIGSGETASSWGYEIEKTKNGYSIYFNNSNVNNGVNIAIIIQYGHGTRNGGYVQGRDYINPAIQPVFDKIAEEAWGEVSKL